eukprot:2867526-Pleurochrysis_carterae.AAC.1
MRKGRLQRRLKGAGAHTPVLRKVCARTRTRAGADAQPDVGVEGGGTRQRAGGVRCGSTRRK